MSDTPSPLPSSDAPKPKLSLSPKAPAEASAAAPASSLAPAPTVASTHVTPQISQAAGNVTPPALAASTAPRQSLKLQGAGSIHPANPDKFDAPKFSSPMPAKIDDAPSGAVVALSAIAAAAAITFAVLLFLKTQS